MSQIPRSSTHEHGPVQERAGVPQSLLFMSGASGAGASASGAGASGAANTSVGSPLARTAAMTLAGSGSVKRMGPHWPPANQERPDPLKTREMLCEGNHRTFGDPHATDRQAPGAASYTIPN